jgi:hypothetical protein
VVNNLLGALKSCVVKSPGFGDSRTERLGGRRRHGQRLPRRH